MTFKLNISDKNKAWKLEIESESLVGKKIGEKISGSEINSDLQGYELEITGTSDKAGPPGLPNIQGQNLKKDLLTNGTGMWDKRKGVRLRKTVRVKLISASTVQINTKVKKGGRKKFEELAKKPETEAESEAKA